MHRKKSSVKGIRPDDLGRYVSMDEVRFYLNEQGASWINRTLILILKCLKNEDRDIKQLTSILTLLAIRYVLCCSKGRDNYRIWVWYENITSDLIDCYHCYYGGKDASMQWTQRVIKN